MIRDYHFVSEYCVVVIQGCDSSEMAEGRLAEIVKHPKRFRLDSVEDDEQLEEWEAEKVKRLYEKKGSDNVKVTR